MCAHTIRLVRPQTMAGDITSAILFSSVMTELPIFLYSMKQCDITPAILFSLVMTELPVCYITGWLQTS